MMATVSVLAEPPKNTGPDFGKASPVGLLVIVLLLIGVFILVWSMNRHLKKLPKTFDTDAEPAETAQTGDADGAPAAPVDAPEKPAHEPGG
ncbi:MAG TPA: hypothetical protein PLI79_16860 [Mycobacterium sp.]|jgi:hypothetical protein|nr:hypothetical protein [Mycobacterium sp.]HNP12142.1 hypothetical protein [Mycobacterium sp.]HRD13525.1 hypothetical protein [Mycobacterium sp.]